jgi:hypothetical protein
MSNEIELTGLDGSNPLGFLAALGALRLLHYARPESNVTMGWKRSGCAWRPIVCADTDLIADTIVNTLYETLGRGESGKGRHPFLAIGKNLSVPPRQFAEHARLCVGAANAHDRRWADYVTSFGSEVLVHNELDRINYTEFCFISGSGHQNYLETIQKLLGSVKERHLREAIFGNWTYSDKRLSMRWDPADERQHAYRWSAPSDEAPMTVWGANLLAAEGSSLYPTVPTASGCPTTGFRRQRRQTDFTWPIWEAAITLEVVRSLIAWGELLEDQVNATLLKHHGVAAAFRSRKVKIGEGANFKWSFAPAEAV